MLDRIQTQTDACNLIVQRRKMLPLLHIGKGKFPFHAKQIETIVGIDPEGLFHRVRMDGLQKISLWDICKALQVPLKIKVVSQAGEEFLCQTDKRLPLHIWQGLCIVFFAR